MAVSSKLFAFGLGFHELGLEAALWDGDEMERSGQRLNGHRTGRREFAGDGDG